MIICDGNHGLGAFFYGMDLVHTWEPERSRVAKKFQRVPTRSLSSLVG